jgi:diaminopimelate decarboxylase
MKTDRDLTEAMLSGSHINCDHADEVDRIEGIARAHNTVARVGIRLSFPMGQGWNRFGFVVAEDNTGGACDIAGRISGSRHLELRGIHAQIGTNIREFSRFTAMAEKMAAFAMYLFLPQSTKIAPRPGRCLQSRNTHRLSFLR